MLNVLCHHGFEYHHKRTLKTNFVFVGKAHPGNSNLEGYYNNKIGPGQHKIDMAEGIQALENIVRAIDYNFSLDRFKSSVVAQKWDTGLVEAFCLRGKTY